MKHFIQEAIDTCMEHYASMDKRIGPDNDRLASLQRDTTLTPEYKRSQEGEIKSKHQAFCNASAIELKNKLQNIFDDERKRVTVSIAGKVPTADQMTVLQALRSRKNISQTEFDVYAAQMKGVYLAEMELKEIALDRGLTPPSFVPLEAKLDKLDQLEAKFIPGVLSYEGTPEKASAQWGTSITNFLGHGIPLNAQYIQKHLAELIHDYDSDTFAGNAAKDAELSYMQLQKLIAEHPETAADIKRFVSKNEALLEDKAFVKAFAEFSLGLKGAEAQTTTGKALIKEFGESAVSAYINSLREDNGPSVI